MHPSPPRPKLRRTAGPGNRSNERGTKACCPGARPSSGQQIISCRVAYACPRGRTCRTPCAKARAAGKERSGRSSRTRSSFSKRVHFSQSGSFELMAQALYHCLQSLSFFWNESASPLKFGRCWSSAQTAGHRAAGSHCGGVTSA